MQLTTPKTDKKTRELLRVLRVVCLECLGDGYIRYKKYWQDGNRGYSWTYKKCPHCNGGMVG